MYVGQYVSLPGNEGTRRPAIVASTNSLSSRLFLILESDYVEVKNREIKKPPRKSILPDYIDEQFIEKYINMEDPPAWLASKLGRNLLVARPKKIKVSSERDVKSLKWEELVRLIKQDNLDVDADDFDGRGKLSKIREAIIEELFDDDEDEDDDEDDDDDDDDDDDEEELEEDDINDMSRGELVTLIDDEELDIKPKDKKFKKSKGLAALREAVIEELFDDDDEDDEEEDEGYTEADLKKMGKKELVALVLELQEDDEDDEDDDD